MFNLEVSQWCAHHQDHCNGGRCCSDVWKVYEAVLMLLLASQPLENLFGISQLWFIVVLLFSSGLCSIFIHICYFLVQFIVAEAKYTMYTAQKSHLFHWIHVDSLSTYITSSKSRPFLVLHRVLHDCPISFLKATEEPASSTFADIIFPITEINSMKEKDLHFVNPLPKETASCYPVF